jgi:hypothetical protein
LYKHAGRRKVLVDMGRCVVVNTTISELVNM